MNFKKFSACLLLTILVMVAAAQPPPRVISPELSQSDRITFRIFAPKAESVRLESDDIRLKQSLDLTKDTNGVWEITLGPVAPGAYRYNFNVNGLQVLDTHNPAISEDNTTVRSLVYVPGADFMDTKDVPHGAVSVVYYYSTTFKTTRRLHVYTPAGYESSHVKYPVLYLLHGSGGCDANWSSVGRAGFILDNLIAAGKAKPMVVVMPSGHTPSRPGMPSAGGFESEFENDIMPCVEKRYRLHNNRENRALAGLSMGGGQTLNIGIPHLDQFAYLGIFSAGVFSINGSNSPGASISGPAWEEKNMQALDNAALKKNLKLVWFATGKADFLCKTSQDTVQMLKKHGFDVAYKETEGAHTWMNWREYLHDFARQLFQ